MEPGTRFSKTDVGRQEVARRSGKLTPVQRRLLIMVDGHKSLNDLGAFARVGELVIALQYLLAQAMIVFQEPAAPLEPAVADGFSAPLPLEPPRPATDMDAFIAVREQAARFVHNRLGLAGEPICAAIARSRNPQELRALLRGIEVFVGQRLDADTAQGFARYFGGLLL